MTLSLSVANEGLIYYTGNACIYQSDNTNMMVESYPGFGSILLRSQASDRVGERCLKGLETDGADGNQQYARRGVQKDIDS